MALEDLTGGAKFLGSLVVTNPVATDDRREGDDHIRGVKNVLKNTFPNLNAAMAGLAVVGGKMRTGMPIEVPDGTVGAPAISFAANADMGFYRIGGNQMGISCGGVEVMRITSGRVAATVPFLSAAGTEAAPGFAFAAALDTGLCMPTPGYWALSSAGTVRLRVNPDGNLCLRATTAAPTVANMTSQEVTFSRINDASLRVSMRGQDGVLRSAALALT